MELLQTSKWTQNLSLATKPGDQELLKDPHIHFQLLKLGVQGFGNILH